MHVGNKWDSDGYGQMHVGAQEYLQVLYIYTREIYVCPRGNGRGN